MTVSRISKRFGLLVAAPVASTLIVVVFGILVHTATQREADSSRLVEQTHQVIEADEHVLTGLLNAETATRGFIITGQPSYLQPYEHAPAEIKMDLKRLRDLVQTPSQRLRVDTLDALSNRVLALLGERIDERRTLGFESVQDSMDARRAKTLMDSVRAVLGEIEGDETTLLSERLRDQARFARTVLLVVIMGTLLAGGLSAGIALALARHANQQARLAAELDEKNESLKARTHELRTRSEALESAQAQLVERTREAEAANQAKSQFLARMSHELRTPLNAIGGYAELMEMGIRGPITEEQRADLERIRENGAHLLTLINDLLHFSKLQAGRIDFDLTSVSAREIVGGAEAMIAPQADAKGVTLDVQAPPDRLDVLCDRSKCRQILINLLGNACKFTAPGGVITVSCDAGEECVRIHVADTGTGIPADELDEIFDPFVQGRGQADDGSMPGVGLGLPISRDLARGMGGDLTVRSEPSMGSTFTLVLPRANGDSPSRARG